MNWVEKNKISTLFDEKGNVRGMVAYDNKSFSYNVSVITDGIEILPIALSKEEGKESVEKFFNLDSTFSFSEI